jgi:HEAT repeat protein
VRYFGLIGLAVLPAALAAGCGPARPTLAGGKPVDHWVRALGGADAKARSNAAFKLGNVGPGDPAALPALLGALRDPDAGVRCQAILALVKFGPAAREAVPILAEVQRHHRSARVRAYAGKAVARLRDEPG